jgi:peptidoglycan/xylan/chitin deacetylase (PgdA/CDA1 family)
VKHFAYRLGLDALALTGASRLAAPWTRGVGAILMFHHVRPYVPRDFEPNRILEITPEFLDEALTHAKARGYEIVPLGDVPARLRNPRGRFVALTFDDGYRDNLVHALPVLQKHAAPFTIFATTGFADRTTPLWWSDLEEALDRMDEVGFDGSMLRLETPGEKQAAFARIIARLRGRSWPTFAGAIAAIAREAGVDAMERVDRVCLDWRELQALDRLNLCTVAAHSATHPLLALQEPAHAADEIAGSKARIEEMLARPVHHFAYPVGDPGAAGQREFALAAEAGFGTAVTTRPGVLFPEHAAHLHALPRLSMNGLHQNLRAFDVLLSGTAFAVYNRGRRLNVA